MPFARLSIKHKHIYPKKKDAKEANPLDPETKQDILSKTWYISYFKDTQFIYYGPLSTKRVYIFLKNMYVNLPNENDKKNQFATDRKSDIEQSENNSIPRFLRNFLLDPDV